MDKNLARRKVTPLNEFFGTGKRQDSGSGSVMLKVAQCVPFVGDPANPYKNKWYKGKRLENMVNSVKRNGVMQAITVRPKEGTIEVGGVMLPFYEILVGHNRVRCAGLAGRDEVPAFIRDLSNEEAMLFVIDSNLNQQSAKDMLPSEKARMLKMRNDAYEIYKAKRAQPFSNDIQQASNPCDTEDEGQFPPLGEKEDDDEKSFEDFDPHSTTTERYISLLDLIDDLLDKVDKGEIAVHAGAELSQLKQDEQRAVLDYMNANGIKIDIVKAAALRAYSKAGTLTTERMHTILSGVIKKRGRPAAVKVSKKVISRYFTQGESPDEISGIIEKALESWFSERGRT
jgi:ParB family chromosome partitioning protein